jgi:hypothetical protein
VRVVATSALGALGVVLLGVVVLGVSRLRVRIVGVGMVAAGPEPRRVGVGQEITRVE